MELPVKFCQQCGRKMRPSSKRTCGDNCRQKLSQRRGKRGVPYDEWVPTEAELAEIEGRKAECRRRHFAMMRDLG